MDRDRQTSVRNEAQKAAREIDPSRDEEQTAPLANAGDARGSVAEQVQRIAHNDPVDSHNVAVLANPLLAPREFVITGEIEQIKAGKSTGLSLEELLSDIDLDLEDSGPVSVSNLDDDLDIRRQVLADTLSHLRHAMTLSEAEGQRVLKDADALLDQQSQFLDNIRDDDALQQKRAGMLDAYFALRREVDKLSGRNLTGPPDPEMRAAVQAAKQATKRSDKPKPKAVFDPTRRMSRAKKLAIFVGVLAAARATFLWFELSEPKAPPPALAVPDVPGMAVKANLAPPTDIDAESRAPRIEQATLRQQDGVLLVDMMAYDPDDEKLSFSFGWHQNDTLLTTTAEPKLVDHTPVVGKRYRVTIFASDKSGNVTKFITKELLIAGTK
ncbi:MAG: hypothetical protein H6707_09565 [Deltaproteobacteria bacterium]|nr:hypothetical protein [Deltaproteobacteria bacterium]